MKNATFVSQASMLGWVLEIRSLLDSSKKFVSEVLHKKSSVRIKNLHPDSLFTLSADVHRIKVPLFGHIDGLT
jgi:hypothetical protein